jgi:transcriptional regulator with XRE-family HTH domain
VINRSAGVAVTRTRSSQGAFQGRAEAAEARKTPTADFSRMSLQTQDQHAVRDTRKKMLGVAIGREVRASRQKLGIKVADLAATIQVSSGMLSKIENGNMSPSLTTLQALSVTLGVPITVFLRRFEEERKAVFVKAGAVERRSTRAGHQYNLLRHISSKTSGVVVEPSVIMLSERSEMLPIFQHGGIEFVYMLEGEVVYRHGSNLYPMATGDSLFFDADAPHGPELRERPVRYLSIVCRLSRTLTPPSEHGTALRRKWRSSMLQSR